VALDVPMIQLMGIAMPRIAIIACALSLVATQASASLTIQSSTGGGALTSPGIVHANFDDLTLGAGGGTSAGIAVSFINDAKLVQSSVSPDPTYAMPFLSGANGIGFGSPDQVNGADVSKYITAGKNTDHSLTGPNATLNFGAAYNYLGILWGSVDSYNMLRLYLGGDLVATISGGDVTSNPDGNQGLGGTYYVNITGVSFDKVIATSSEYAFEFDNVAYGAIPEGVTSDVVPETSTIAVWSILSVMGLGMAVRRSGSV
jgi:hypothetical protein